MQAITHTTMSTYEMWVLIITGGALVFTVIGLLIKLITMQKNNLQEREQKDKAIYERINEVSEKQNQCKVEHIERTAELQKTAALTQQELDSESVNLHQELAGLSGRFDKFDEKFDKLEDVVDDIRNDVTKILARLPQ